MNSLAEWRLAGGVVSIFSKRGHVALKDVAMQDVAMRPLEHQHMAQLARELLIVDNFTTRKQTLTLIGRAESRTNKLK